MSLCYISYPLLIWSLLSAPPGFKKGGAVDLCQQAGCERLHVCGWDLPEPAAYLRQRPPVAHPGLLRAHWRGVRTTINSYFILYCSDKCSCRDLVLTRFYFCSHSLPYPNSSTTLPMSCSPPGCARALSGWCHGCVWDDDLWLWSRVRPCSLFLSLPPDRSLKMGGGWGWGQWMDGPLLFPVKLTWADRCQDVKLFCDNLFYKRRLNSEQKKNMTFFRRTLDSKRHSNYLNFNFCTVFF